MQKSPSDRKLSRLAPNTSTVKLSFTINEFRQSTGICRTRIYELIAAGTLRTVKLGRSRLVTADAASEFIASLEQEAA